MATKSTLNGRQTSREHGRVFRTLADLYLDPVFKVVMIVGSSLLFVAAVLVSVSGAGMVGALLLFFALACGAITLTSRYAFKERAVDHLTELMWAELEKNGIEDFDLAPLVSGMTLPHGAVREAAEAVYSGAVKRVAADLKETSKERNALERLRDKLGLEPRAAQKVEKDVKADKYSDEVQRRLEDDGRLDRAEQAELRRIRRALNLDTQEAYEGAGDSFRERYKGLFERFIRDGHLSEDEIEQLRRYREATGLPAEKAADITRKEAMDLYRRTVHMVCQDGKVTDAEREELETLKEVLGLQPEQVSELDEKVEETAELERIRNGHLPEASTPPDIILDGAETCHWYAEDATYRRMTGAGNEKRHDGSLVITDKRFWFNSQEYPVEFKPKKIMNIRTRPLEVELRLNRKKGQGVYVVDDANKVGAILHALARGIVAAGSDSSRSRHIPDHVKVKVWRRDGGQCVNCGAEEPLEYDHIIPFSKGGSNRPDNIQLLCARCNRSKSAEVGGVPSVE